MLTFITKLVKTNENKEIIIYLPVLLCPKPVPQFQAESGIMSECKSKPIYVVSEYMGA